MKRLNYDRLFDEVLKIFFSKADIRQFENLVAENNVSTNKSYSNLINTEREQMNFEINDYTNTQQQIDLLITFASNRLSTKKYLELIQNLGQYCITIGEYNPAESLFEKIVNQIKKENKYFTLRADAFANLSEIHRRKAMWKDSLSCANKASTIYKKYNDRAGQARCFNLIGTIYGEQGNFKKAKEYFEKSLSFLGSSRDAEFKGKIEVNMGIINDILGNYDEALSYFNRALITYNKSSNLKRIAEIRHNIGMMYNNTQKPGTALKEFDKSISTCMKIGYLPILGISYLGKSHTFTIKEDYNLADAFADKAMQICHKINDKLSIADAYKIKGIIQRERKNYGEAENYLKTSLRINKELGNKLNEAETHFELGLLYKNIGNTPKSKSKFTEALNYFKSLKADLKVKRIKSEIANLAAA